MCFIWLASVTAIGDPTDNVQTTKWAETSNVTLLIVIVAYPGLNSNID